MRVPTMRPWLVTLAFAAGCLFLTGAAAVGWVFVEQQWPAEPITFARQRPAVGDPAPDFTLRDLDGREYALADVIGKRPIVIEFGSVTCLQCVHGRFDRKEALAREYAGRAEFLFVYCREAHPDRAFGSMALTSEAPGQTVTWDQRAERARTFRKTLNVGRTILIDGDGDDSIQDRYGGRDNQAVIIDTDGRIAFKEKYTDHRDIQAFLEQRLSR